MKFATLPNGQPDGRLHIVSRDLTRATPARAAQTLQAALENWTTLEPSSRPNTPRCNRAAASRSTLAPRSRRCRAPGNGWTVRRSTATAS